MADYQARINLLVAGQDSLSRIQRQVEDLEGAITAVERRWRTASAALTRSRTVLGVTGTDLPRGAGGRFAQDPDRQQRINALAAQRQAAIQERIARLTASRTRQEIDNVNTRLAAQERLNRRVENQIALESRLNAAVDLYRTNLRKFERGGSGRQDPALVRNAEAIQEAFAAFEAGGSRNLRLVRSLATELGRVGEAQRELNRAQSLGSKGFEAGRRLQERLSVVAQAGTTSPERVRAARSMATEAISASRSGDQQAYTEAIRRATAATSRLERESRETAAELDAQQRRIARLARLGGPSSPVQGAVDLIGSPINKAMGTKAAVALAQQKEKAAADELKALQGGTKAAVSLARQKEKAAADELKALQGGTKAAVSLARQKEKAAADELKALQGGTKSAVALAQQKQQAAAEELKALQGGTKAAVSLARQKEKAAADELKALQKSTKDAVALAQQKQKTLDTQSKERTGMVQNALIGGAFPLLFGGGAGAVAGGFAGGFIPGNPLMSIVTSALGTMVDQFVAGVAEMGVAVRDLVGNFDKLKEANLFVSKEQEFYIQKLIESGRAQEAANVIQQRLIDIIGTQGVQDLENAGQASIRLNKAFAELSIQMQAFVAGPLAALLNRLSGAVALPAASNKATALQIQLNQQGDTAAAQRLGTQVQQIQQSPNVQFGLDPQKAAQDIQKITDYYAQFLKTKEKAASISLVDREKTIKQAEQIFTELRDKERAQQELKRQNAEQYADLVRSLQRQQADLNLRYERRAQDLRISNAEKQLSLVKAIGDAQLQQLQNEARARQIEAGGGTGLAAEIAAALDTYDIELKRIGQEAADAEQKAKLNVIKLDVENERFKLDNAKTIARTNLDNQIRIQRINEQINRQNAALSRRNYEQDIQVASITLSNIRADAQANRTVAQAALAQRTVTEDQRAYYTTILNGFNQVIQESEKAAEQVTRGFIKPSALPTMAAAPTLQQPGTAAIDAQVEKAKQLTAELAAVAAGQNRVNAETTAYLTLTEKTTAFVKQFEAQTRSIENETEARKLRNRLALEGVAPEIIEGELRILELSRAYTETAGALDAQLQKLLPVKIENTNQAYQAALGYLAELEALGPLTAQQEELRKKLQSIVDLREQLGVRVNTAADSARSTAAAQVQTPTEKVEERIGALKKELADLTNIGNIAITVADGIGSAFSTSFKGIISGSMTAKEALANFFTSVADMFLDMAAQIIAKWIQMTILNTILQLFPGGSGGSGGGLGSSQFKPGSGAQLVPSLPGAKDYSGAFKKRANGGPVSGGQTYMVGERGPELFVPGRSGTIVANNKMGGGNTNVVVNVDAKGSSVEGDEQGANQLGRVISAAVQSELIKQQRPGGILAR